MDISDEYLLMCQRAKEIQAVKEQGQKEFYRNIDDGRCWVPIWLPRQDQLQKMVALKYEEGFWEGNSHHGYPISFIEDFTQFVRCCVAQNCDSVIWSFEQFWLAFVMKEKFNKIWEDNDWKENK